MICNSLLFMIGCFCKMICNLVCFPTEVIALLPWGGKPLDGPGKVIFCVCDFRGCLELCSCGCFSQCTCIALTRHHLAKVHWERIWDYIEDQPSSGLKLVFNQGAKSLHWKKLSHRNSTFESSRALGNFFCPLWPSLSSWDGFCETPVIFYLKSGKEITFLENLISLLSRLILLLISLKHTTLKVTVSLLRFE